jgi:hypothetical protein
VSPDGRHIMSGGSDGNIRWWDLETGSRLPSSYIVDGDIMTTAADGAGGGNPARFAPGVETRVALPNDYEAALLRGPTIEQTKSLIFFDLLARSERFELPTLRSAPHGDQRKCQNDSMRGRPPACRDRLTTRCLHNQRRAEMAKKLSISALSSSRLRHAHISPAPPQGKDLGKDPCG